MCTQWTHSDVWSQLATTPECLFKIGDRQSEKKQLNGDRRAICNVTRCIDAGRRGIRHRGVSESSDRAIPPGRKCFLLMYFLNYLCLSWSHGRHRVDSSSALISKSLTLPTVCAFILSKFVIMLMGFPRLGVAFYTETVHECTYSQLYSMRHGWYVVPQCWPLNSGGLKGWLQLTSHRVIWGSSISCNSKQTALGKLTTSKNILSMYS